MTLTDTEKGSSKVGIIIPPPDVRNIVDRTAEFVARNGPEFETRVKLNEANNIKFNFLNATDPYHAYYQHRVNEYLEGTVEPTSLRISAPTAMKLVQDTPRAIQEVFEPKEPPPDYEFIVDPPSINGLELDIVKLTAQFVARNGRQFLTQLMTREQRNYLFDFLRPQHNMFSYFTKLVEQFTKILLPANDITRRLSDEANDAQIFMKNCKYRVQWERYQARIRKKELEMEDKERMAYAQIDWHDFVVVENVDYPLNEVGNFPPLTLPEEVGARVIAEERGEQIIPMAVDDRPPENLEEEEMENEEEESDVEEEGSPVVHDKRKDDAENDDEDMEVSDEEDSVVVPPPPPQALAFKQPAPVTEAGKTNIVNPEEVIIKQYDPKLRQKAGGEQVVLISPLGDQRKVPVGQANKHVHVGLLDPQWKAQRDRSMRNRAQDDSTYATGSNVDENLKRMAERRTDIFGSEETVIGKKVGEEDAKKSDRYSWDGHSLTHEPTIKRSSDVNTRVEEKEVDFDRIGPQAVPQPAPATTITIIVNTPIITSAVSQLNSNIGEPDEKRVKRE